MLNVRISNSTSSDWYYKLQFKNNKAKTFQVVPTADFSKFMIMSGENYGKEINPAHVKPIAPTDLLKFLKSFQ